MITARVYSYVIIEDNPVMQKGLAYILRRFDNLVLKGQYYNIESAREPLTKIQPDLILLDIILTGLSGDKGCAQLKKDLFKPPKVIAYTNSSFHSKDLIKWGFDGYVHKNEPVETLISVIQDVLEGSSGFGASRDISPTKDNYSYNTSKAPREFQIMAMAVMGKTNKEIGDLLHISIETVKKSRQNFKTKANLRDKSIYGIREYLEKEHGYTFRPTGSIKADEEGS
ncbi:response regulator transcription factor [Niabella hirudinis]|uniref:response regulator transcription factor n=1 Tax=Niabella hirudinis TaxID=1285929 RepID=UPI003EB6F57C